MIVFSNCKVNLGLHIVNKRPDGFHNIETVFIPVPWNDVIEVERSEISSLEIHGRKIDGKGEDNFCIKACRVLAKEFKIPPIKLCLLKNIPLGAGLGGGSANAAITLTMLNDFLSLGISLPQLKNYAATIGSDCSFFLENKPSLATSRGEVMENISLNLAGAYLVLLYPGIHINTAWAYKIFAAKNMYRPHSSLKELLREDKKRWKLTLVNDFEPVVFEEHPVLAHIKEGLYKKGAFFAGMSGSGSALFGLFEKPQNTKKLASEFEIAEQDVFGCLLES